MQTVLRNPRVAESIGKRICFSSLTSQPKIGLQKELSTIHNYGASSFSSLYKTSRPVLFKMGMIIDTHLARCITTTVHSHSQQALSRDDSTSEPEVPPQIKFKRLDKTARHIMQILDKEAVEEVKETREIAREIAEIKPGYIIQLKVEVPENKRRVSTMKGIVIARRNAGLNSTFRIRRLVAGVGVENIFPLYSPNIKELKILEKKKVRRAKLYYLRDKMNALKKQTTR